MFMKQRGVRAKLPAQHPVPSFPRAAAWSPAPPQRSAAGTLLPRRIRAHRDLRHRGLSLLAADQLLGGLERAGIPAAVRAATAACGRRWRRSRGLREEAPPSLGSPCPSASGAPTRAS